MADFWAAFKYYLAMQCAAAAAVPLCFLIFRRLHDRGWAIAKIVGPLLMVYLSWVGAHWWWDFSRTTMAFCLFQVAAVGLLPILANAYAGGAKRWIFFTFLRRRLRLLLTIELIFLIGFTVGCLTRALAPEATFEINRSAAEKFFDFTLLHNLYLTENFPADDTWLAGYKLNYYYFGHLLFVALGRMANVSVGFTFNLALAAVVGLLGALSFSFAYQFTRSKAWSALAALLVCAAGNLDAVRQVFSILKFDTGKLFRDFDFWASSRVIPQEMITEFPAFSFILGDPHAHVLALPLVLAALLTLVALGRGLRVLRRDPAAASLKLLPLWLLLALIIGALSAANLWDYYTLSAISLFILGGLLLCDARDHPWSFAAGVVMCLLMIAFGRSILFWQYQQVFTAPVSAELKLTGWLPARWEIVAPVGIVAPEIRSPILPFLMHWGLWLAPLALYFTPGCLMRLWRCRRDQQLFFVVLTLLIIVGGYNLGANLACPLLLLLMAAVIFHRPWAGERPGSIMMRLLLLAAFIILLGAELIYVDDHYVGVNERMNTLFKLTYPVWVVLVCGAVWSWAELIRRWRGPELTTLLGAGCCLMILLGLFYPVLGVGSRVEEHKRFPGPGRIGTLDSLRYLENDPVYGDDFRMAQWMKQNLPREMVILEAGGEAYSAHGRIAAWSGIPAVLGWAGHECGWRGEVAVDEIYDRLALIDQFYQDPKPEWAAALEADFIIFGALERERFGELAPLLNQHFRLVEQIGATRLYRVGDQIDKQ